MRIGSSLAGRAHPTRAEVCVRCAYHVLENTCCRDVCQPKSCLKVRVENDVFTYPTQLRLSVCPEPQPRDASHNPAPSLCIFLLCRPLRNRLLYSEPYTPPPGTLARSRSSPWVRAFVFKYASVKSLDKIHTQLAKATSLGGGRPAHVTNGRPLPVLRRPG